MGERSLCESAYFCELRRFVSGVEDSNRHVYEIQAYERDQKRSFVANGSTHLFRLFLTGINPQIARRRGCDQMWNHSRGRERDRLTDP